MRKTKATIIALPLRQRPTAKNRSSAHECLGSGATHISPRVKNSSICSQEIPYAFSRFLNDWQNPSQNHLLAS